MAESPRWGGDAPREAGAPTGSLGRARRFALGATRELLRFEAGDEGLARRLVALGGEGLFGVLRGGVDGGPWIERRVQARSLEDLARGEALPPKIALEVFASIAGALGVCERAALFPGPLRPGEVALGAEDGPSFLRGEALLSALLGAPSASPARPSPRWSSPEVIAGGSFDNAANRYVLGLLAYRMLAGEHPFSGSGLRHGLNASTEPPPPFAEALARSLPPGVQALVLSLLDPDAEARPRSSAEIVRRLAELRGAAGPSLPLGRAPRAPVQTPLEEPARSPRVPLGARLRRSDLGKPWTIVPLALALLAGATAFTSSSPPASPPPPKIAPARAMARARAADCAPCHAREVGEWERSVMAHAARSPLFGALESAVEEQIGRDTRCPNGAGALRRRGVDSCADTASGVAITGAGGEHWCVNCHSPTEGSAPTVPSWGALGSDRSRAPLRDLLSEDASEGISCASCHQTVGPVSTHAEAAGRYEGNATWTSISTGATFLARPEDGEGRPGIGNSGYRLQPSSFLGLSKTREQPGDPVVHRRAEASASSYLRTSEFCGACHDVRLFGTDVLGKSRGEHFKRLRNGYSEWRSWAEGEIARGRRAATCQDCHMSQFPGVCVPGAADAGSPQDPRCPPGRAFAARAPGEYARGLAAPSSPGPRALFSHYFTSVDVPLTPSFPEAWADETSLDAHGSPRGLRPRRDLLLRSTFRFGLGEARRSGKSLEIPVELENVGAGHRVPAGFSQEREVWVELTVLDARGDRVSEVGRLRDSAEDLADKRFLRVNVLETHRDSSGRPLGLFGADVADGPDVPAWSPNPRFGGSRFRGRGLVNLQNGFLRCVRCIGQIDAQGRCQPGQGQGRTRADRYDDAFYDIDTGECRSNLSGGEELFETYFPVGALDAERGVTKAPDAIVDTRSAPPGVPLQYTYVLDVGAHPGPYRIEARLRFRSFPPFLVRAFADYERDRAARGERPSGAQVTLAMLGRIDVIDLARATARIE